MKSTFRIPRGIGRRVILILILILVIALGLSLIYLWDHHTTEPSDSVGTSSQNEQSEIFVNGTKYALKEDIETVLFLGVDKYEDDAKGSYINNQMADVLMLMIVDHQAESYTLVQLNRDTMTQIKTLGVTGDTAGKITAQLALAHAYGTGGGDSARNTVNAVSHLFYNVPIEHYASIKMDAIPILNDAVGGVEVQLLDDFTSLDPSFVEGATVTLMNDQATTYVQARSGLEDSSNIHRLERQRQYITAWYSNYQAKALQDDMFVTELVIDISNYLITDLSAEQVRSLTNELSEYTSDGIQTIAGESVRGEEYMEFYVDESALQEQVLKWFYEPIE